MREEKFSEKETQEFEKGLWRMLSKNQEKREELKIVVIAIFIGFFGGISADFFYDISKGWPDKSLYITVNIIIFVLFLFLVGVILTLLKIHEQESENTQRVLGNIKKYGLKKIFVK